MRGSFKYVIFLFILCIFAAFFISSSFFQIKYIEVNGNKNVTREEIIKLSSVYYGENIFRINKKNSMKSIFQNPYVKMIKIKRVIPNKVIIDIIERQAAAYVPYVGSYLNIDEDGMILEVNPAINKPDLPVVRGLAFETFKIGEILSIKDKEQLTVMKALMGELKSVELIGMITEMDISDKSAIRLRTKTDIKINLGTMEDINYRISFAKSILDDAVKRNLKGTIEMSHKGNPVFKPE